jgi:8-oxo-dGTP pyrophosphatase MutT (NUDIX family)
VVAVNETEEENAYRELEEELGIKNVYLEPIFKFYFEGCGSKCWGSAY